MSDGITGISTVFARSDGVGGFTPVANVFGISGPSMSRETVEITTYDSTDGYREKIGGLRDAGQITFTMNFTIAEYQTFKTEFEQEATEEYRVTLPDSTTFTFDGLVVELPLTIPEGDRITADITIEISGTVAVA